MTPSCLSRASCARHPLSVLVPGIVEAGTLSRRSVNLHGACLLCIHNMNTPDTAAMSASLVVAYSPLFTSFMCRHSLWLHVACRKYTFGRQCARGVAQITDSTDHQDRNMHSFRNYRLSGMFINIIGDRFREYLKIDQVCLNAWFLFWPSHIHCYIDMCMHQIK